MKTFLLSPAKTTGKRAQMLFNKTALFPLARRLHEGEAVALGEIFSFLSGLYFRGKLSYALRFAEAGNVFIITSNLGLLRADTPITLPRLQSFSTSRIDTDEPTYVDPLIYSLRALKATAHTDDQFILLGSIATDKYVLPLASELPQQLYFPKEFIGRGDMSRGGMLLRSVRSGDELTYQKLSLETQRSGVRAGRLATNESRVSRLP